MADPKKKRSFSKLKFSLHWVLFILTLGVLVLSSLVFIKPISQNGSTLTPTPFEMMTATAEVKELPPTPDEIGYTDGIIFFSTILVLILLVGTLRETIRREGR
jgi:hypothetical protein